MINERYTTKTCSKCGNYNEKMEGEKVYECDKRDNKMKNRYFNVEKYMVSFI